MSRDISNIKQWQLWLDSADNITFLSDYKPSDLASLSSNQVLISVLPATVIAVRVWGVGDANDSTAVRFSGWMDPNTKRGSGPGQVLWMGNVIIGAKEITAPLYTGAVSRNWREVDEWYIAGTSTIFADPGVLTDTTIPSGIFLLPTLGYTHILLEADVVPEGFNAIDRLTILWREAMRGEVLPGFHTTAI